MRTVGPSCLKTITNTAQEGIICSTYPEQPVCENPNFARRGGGKDRILGASPKTRVAGGQICRWKRRERHERNQDRYHRRVQFDVHQPELGILGSLDRYHNRPCIRTQ